jgi:hypothetical protein
MERRGRSGRRERRCRRERVFIVITPYIRILDFDWTIAGVFFVYFHI